MKGPVSLRSRAARGTQADRDRPRADRLARLPQALLAAGLVPVVQQRCAGIDLLIAHRA